MTFEEAYVKTARHVSISVSASSAHTVSGGTYKLLLNHISTPHVLLASAVRASCALPGIMSSATLMKKNKQGEVVPYLNFGNMQWVDGSITSDSPRSRISSLFNVTNFLVSQVNPHIVPFIAKSTPGARKKGTGCADRLMHLITQDIRRRCTTLADLGVIPRLFGQDINKVFSQKYSGNVNFVPALGLQDNFKAIMNPTVEDMQRYIREGQRCSWGKLPHATFLMRIEKEIQQCLAKLCPGLRVSRASHCWPSTLTTNEPVESSEERPGSATGPAKGICPACKAVPPVESLGREMDRARGASQDSGTGSPPCSPQGSRSALPSFDDASECAQETASERQETTSERQERQETGCVRASYEVPTETLCNNLLTASASASASASVSVSLDRVSPGQKDELLKLLIRKHRALLHKSE